MTNKTIAFGDDGSPAADIAWLWINDHRWDGWDVQVICADPPKTITASESRPEFIAWEPTNPRPFFAEARLAAVRHVTIAEDPRLALSRAVDLLVIGARGPGVLKALHLGSTAEWLMARPPAPMVIPRHGRPTRSVVVCADGSPHAQAAVDALCAMPWVAGLAVTVVGVADGVTDAEQAVADVSVALLAAGAHVTQRVLDGDATDRIVEFLEHDRPDLVVLGTRGLTGVRRAFVGSTASAIAHSGNHSVLVACADAAVAGRPD